MLNKNLQLKQLKTLSKHIKPMFQDYKQNKMLLTNIIKRKTNPKKIQDLKLMTIQQLSLSLPTNQCQLKKN
ncbi:MAG: hypothetical protein DRP42_04445 [Tenericutes bacterium]|nr:MAG: hypothetical protein DRP42_04445 [Mycoplasmatota bacterium]